VGVRNQKSTVLKVNYRRVKPVFRRVTVISGVRSLSLYLVVELLCQLVIVICVVIISIVNKSGNQSEST
jgi:hypothetical protein